MTQERPVTTESLFHAEEFDRTWAIAQNIFIEQSCTTDNSVNSYRRDLDQLKNFLGGRGINSWQAITPQGLADFFERNQTGSPQKYSANSVRKQLAVIRGFFNWVAAQSEYPVSTQTLEAIRSMRQSPKDKSRIITQKSLSRSELISIAAIPDSRDQALIQLLQSGINPGKLEKLTIANIKGNPANSNQPLRIEMPQMKNRETRWTERTLNKEADSALRRYLLERSTSGTSLDEPLFPSRGGTWFIVTEWGKKIGIPCNPRQIIKSARLAK